ncbi:MAG: hypothetical protein AB1648_02300 [Pseudomonadota bacterium]
MKQYTQALWILRLLCMTVVLQPFAPGSAALPMASELTAREINVKDFGAKSDGMTDDSAAVQFAINSVSAYAGGIILIPPNTAIRSTINITNKMGIIITGPNGQGFPYVGASFTPTLKWIGPPGGTIIQITNPLEVTLRNMSISGENVADYCLRISGTRSGWGVSNFENMAIYGANRNAMLKDATGAAGDFGRNHFKRVTFSCSHPATGVAKHDACVTYNNDSSVQDVYDHCEIIYTSSGVHVAGTYGMWIEAGTPRIQIHNSYTKAATGIATKATGATPRFVLSDHYSEDINFLLLPNANTPQVVRNAFHALDGGISITWGGAAGGGVPLIIDGGYFSGSLALNNLNAGVIFSNSPVFLGGYPSTSTGANQIVIGRSNGAAAIEAHGAINADAFVPAVAANQTKPIIHANLALASVFPATLNGNSTVAAPSAIDPNGLDVGRVIEYQIKGHSVNTYAVTFNAIFKLAGGTFAHSGATKTDVIRFRWNGTNWIEIGRSMGIY